MQTWMRQLGERAIGAAFILVLLSVALLAGGANRADLAALLAAALLGLLAIFAVAAPRGRLARTLGDNWLSIGAAIAFLGLAAASLLAPPLSGLASSALTGGPLANAGGPASLAPYRTIEGMVAFLVPCAAYLLGALCAPNARARDWCGRWMMAGAILYCFAALYIFLTIGARGGRLDAGVSSANAAATLFGAFVLIGVGMMARGARGRLQSQETLPGRWRAFAFAVRAPVSLAAAMLAFACLLLTASRAGIVATAIGFLVLLLALTAQRFRSAGWRGGFVLAPLLTLSALFFFLFLRGGEDVVERFAFASRDWEIRRLIAETHWHAAMMRPVFGYGLNTFHELNMLVATAENWRALRNPGSTHNIFIQAIAEMGFVGLGLWILMLAQPMLRAIGRIATGRGGVEWAAIALAATAIFLLHGFVDFSLQVPAIGAWFAFLLGASVGRAGETQHGFVPRA